MSCDIVKMEFIEEENDDTRISEACRLKDEDTEEQSGWCPFLILYQ